MKLLITTLLLVSSVLGNMSECECDAGRYIDPVQSLCVQNPANGDDGFIADCESYKIKDIAGTPTIVCEKCIATHKIKDEINGTTSCETHSLSNCIYAITYVSRAGGGATEECLQCDTGSFQYEEEYYGEKYFYCIDNPTSGNPGHVTGCEEYYKDASDNTVCFKCATDKEVSDGSTCAASSAIPNCKQYITTSECYECDPGYVLDNDGVEDTPGANCHQKPTSIGQCAEYKTADGSTWKCVRCNAGFYITAGGDQCTGVTTTVDNCHKYSSATVCEICEPERWYDSSDSECKQCPPKDGSAIPAPTPPAPTPTPPTTNSTNTTTPSTNQTQTVSNQTNTQINSTNTTNEDVKTQGAQIIKAISLLLGLIILGAII